MTSQELKNELLEIEIYCEEDLNKIEKILRENDVEIYKIDYDLAYDSCGYDVYYYCVAYNYNEEIEIVTGTWSIY